MSEIKTNKISPRKGTTQTIGDSGDTVSIACGATVTNAGTISTAGITGGTINNTTGTITGLQGVINWDTTAKTTNFNASSQAGYFVNTTSGAITVTFPASPSAGDVIALKDYANTFDTNNLTIDANGNNIQGSATNFDITVEGTSAQFIYVDATRGWVLTDASKASDIAEGPTFICATGGTVTTCGDCKIHTFTGPGTFTVNSLANCAVGAGPNNVDYLVVAGGGGGGHDVGGGAGAGGYRTSFPTCGGSLPVSVTGYPITVGGGGSGGPGPGTNNGAKGSDSIFSTITSTGGGYGGGFPGNNGGPGGSGGGGAGSVAGFGSPTTSGGTGNTPPVSPSQGNNGGASPLNSPGSNVTGGGGGGAGGTGNVGVSAPSATFGPRAAGATNSISSSPLTYAEGGRGAGDSASPSIAGGANTGTGGDASGGGSGAAGGSGIVIIRYKYQ